MQTGSWISRVALGGLLAGSLIGAAGMHAAPSMARIVGNTPELGGARALGAINASQSVDITVGMQLRNQARLDAFLGAVQQPASSEYGRFLSPAQFTAQYGPTTGQVVAVERYLQGEGLRVTHVSRNRMLIDASGSAARVERAFDVTLERYSGPSGAFMANIGDPSVPADLASSVQSILGLDTMPSMQPQLQRVAHPSGAHPFTPAGIQAAYNATSLIHAGNTGKGETIAILTCGTYSLSDVRAFESHYGLPQPSYTNELVQGAPNCQSAASIETWLDTEWSGAMASGAKIIVYEAHDPNDKAFIAMYNKWATDKSATVSTTSWADYEYNTKKAIIMQYHSAVVQASAEGMPLFASSGDSAAFDSTGKHVTVMYPASDPDVTGTGGTTLYANGNTITQETGWNLTTGFGGVEGGGGGQSIFFSRPSWQKGLGTGTSKRRGVPDVSYDADPNTGFPVYAQGSWNQVGGTSDAAPQWAGLLADMLQVTGDTKPIGNFNPIVYGIEGKKLSAPAFHDITSGFNGKEHATKGWDYVTGWGSPNVANLAKALKAAGY